MTEKVSGSMRSFALHSNKGGVGKTTLAVNIAVALAKRGFKVCLLDYDLGGPNLYSFFDNVQYKYINEFLIDGIPLEECLVDISGIYNLKGSLYIGFANPSAKSVDYMLNIQPNDSIKLLSSSFMLKKKIINDYKIDFFIVDTTPGLSLLTMNSFLLVDIIIFTIMISNSDINGTIEVISGLAEYMNNQAGIIANNIPENFLKDVKRRLGFENNIISDIKQKTGIQDITFLGWIPQDEKLKITEFENALAKYEGKNTQRIIHAISKPNHLIMKIIDDMINNYII